MVELCLMASHGCPPGLGVALQQEQASSRATEGFHHFFPCNVPKQDLINSPHSLYSSILQKEERRSAGGLLDGKLYFRIDSTTKRSAIIEFQETHRDSVHFSMGIAERCARHEKILKLLASVSFEKQDLLDLAVLHDMMGPEVIIADLAQEQGGFSSRWCFKNDQPLWSLIYPTNELYLNKPLLGLAEYGNDCPGKAYHLDVQLQYDYTVSEMNDIMPVLSDLYMSKNTNKSTKQTLLVPYFERRRRNRAKTDASKLAYESIVSLKSHTEVKEKAPQKKKTNARTGRERDVYNGSYLHACESLLSVIVGRNQHGKATILTLKKSSPQLPLLLTQFSATIAGTGIAVVFSVLGRVACGRFPLGAPKLLSTGLGFGLVWLSWAVNRLRDTIISINKTNNKLGDKEEEIMGNLDQNLKEIYFRAATLLVLAVLRVA